MKIKIISDGTNSGTKIINKETGEMIGMVQNVTWSISSKDIYAKATIEILNPEIELECDDVKIASIAPSTEPSILYINNE